MASFTEQATLKVVDQSSKQISKINAELKKLFATANSLKNKSLNIKVNATGIEKTLAALRKLNAAAQKNKVLSVVVATNAATKQLGRTAAATTKQVTSGLAQTSRAQQQHNQHVIAAVAHQKQLVQQQQRAARFTPSGVPRVAPPPATRQPWGPPRQPPPHTPTPPAGGSGGRGGGRTPMQAGLAGFAGGFGMGLSRLGESFGAVSLAGFAAARALEAVGKAAYNRDRAQLSEFAQSSPEQRAELRKLDEERGPQPGPIKISQDEWRTIRASMMADVGNSGRKPGDVDYVDPKSVQGAIQRARRADTLMRYYDEHVVPGIYARDKTKSPLEALEDLKKDAQAMGISTEEMFTTVKDANGQVVRDARTGLPQETLSPDFERVSRGVAIARAADKDITSGLIKTVIGQMKTLGYTGTSEQIAETILNAGTKGQKAANEAYRMLKIGQGVVDNKKLNTKLAAIGAFEPGTVEYDTNKRTGAKSARVGTGVPRTFYDSEGKPITLEERPGEWWRKLYEEGVEPIVRKDKGDEAARVAKKAGKNKAQQEAARKAAEQSDITAGERAGTLSRTLGSAPAAGVAGIFDAVFGGEQVKSAIAQGIINASKESHEALNKEMQSRWSVQADNLMTVIKGAFADFGEKALAAFGGAKTLENLGTLIANNTTWSSIGLIAGPLVAVGIVSAFTTSVAGLLAVGLGAMFRGLIPAVVRTILGGGAAAGAAGAAGTIAGGAAGAGAAARIAGLINPVTGAVITGAMLLDYVLGTKPDKMRDDMIKAAANKQISGLGERIYATEKELSELEGSGVTDGSFDARIAALKKKLAEQQERMKVLTDLITPPKIDETDTGSDVDKAIKAEAERQRKAAEAKGQPGTIAASPAAVAAAAAPENVAALAKLIPQLEVSANSIMLAGTALKESGTTIGTAVTALGTANTGLGTSATAIGTAVTSLGTTTTAFSASATAMATNVATVATSITMSIASLSAAGTTFATVFQTGATALTTAGQTAAATLQGAAPGIGQTIGNAAAAAISAATANISVNVNNTATPAAPTGANRAGN